MRCVVITPLGALVEPDVNSSLAIVSGPVAACAASSAGPGWAASRRSKPIVARPSMRPSASTTGTSAGTTAAMARA